MSSFAIIAAALLVLWFGSVLVGSGELRGLGETCAWYWRRGLWTPITAALFLYLVVGIAFSLYSWIFLTGYLAAAAGQLLGTVAGFFTASLAIVVLMISPGLWYSLLKNTPGLWNSKRSRWSKVGAWLAVFVGFQVVAYGLNHGALRLGAWMADRHQMAEAQRIYPLPSPSPSCAEAIREYANCGASAGPSVSKYLADVATVCAFCMCYSRVSPKLRRGRFWSTEETTPERAALLAEFLRRVEMTKEQAESVFYSSVDTVPHASDLTKLGTIDASKVEQTCGEATAPMRRVDAACVNY